MVLNPGPDGSEIDGILFLSRTRDMIRRRLVLFIVLVILGIGGGVVASKLTEPYFTSKLTGGSQTMPFSSLATIIAPINQYIKDGSHDVLAERLNITTDQAKQLKSVEIVDITELEANVDNSAIDHEFVPYFSLFELSITAFDAAVVAEVQTGLLGYMRSNNYHRKKIELTKQALEDDLKAVELKLHQLDTIHSNLAAATKAPGSSSVSLDQPFSEWQELQEYKRTLQQQLAFVDDIQFLTDFATFEMPTGPSTTRMAINGGILGILFSVFLIALLELNLIIKEQEAARGRQ